MAREVAAALETVQGIETAWVVGDEGKKELGRAVIEHMLHCTSGECWSWEEGQLVKVPAFSRGITLPFSDPLATGKLTEGWNATLRCLEKPLHI